VCRGWAVAAGICVFLGVELDTGFIRQEPSQRWGSLFPLNAWESALPAACRPPQTGPLIMPGPVLCLFLSTPLLQSKSWITRSRVRHKRWRGSTEHRAIRDRRGLVSLQLAT
jgi:hypothetical protein